MDEMLLEYAKTAYDAYGAVTDHKNYQGLPMPEWDNLTERIQKAWIGAVTAVLEKAANNTDDLDGFVAY